MSAPTIRQLQPRDAPLLAAFAERLFRETYDSPAHVDMLDPYCARAFAPGVQEGELAEAGAAALLAEVGGEPAGYAQLRRRPAPVAEVDPGAIEVARFYVDRRHHGTGVAHALMDTVLAHAATEGAREVWLQVAEYNDRALAFYRKRGFRSVGRIPFDFAGVRELDHLLAIGVG